MKQHQKAILYALGVTWYELLAGEVPDPAAVGARQYSPASSDTETNALIDAMLAFAPAGRPSVEEVLEFLSRPHG
jgi:serine/threonine protein kinase